ncbi:MAG: phosphoglycerate dehydrogenase [Oscillospiraceae bacterium]
MKNIKIINKISPAGLARFDMDTYRCGENVTKEEGIVVRSADMHEMQFAPTLKAIARAGSGTNNIPLDRCSEQGIVVFNTPGANSNAVKEMVFLSLLISSRKIPDALNWVQTLKGEGENIPELVEKFKSNFAGPELKGKSLGIVGLGAIGRQVANLATRFDMTVYGYDPYISVDSAWELSRAVIHARSMEEIYKNCDYITLHLGVTEQTIGMINAESIRSMKRGVRILNFSRGDLVISEDIVEAIKDVRIRSYVTDFPDDILIGQPGVICLPHLGASTPESEENCARWAADQLIDYLENGNIRNSVNMPTVYAERAGDMRVGCIHQNIPTMIAQISNSFSEATINIENLTSKSRGDYAYTIVDVTGDVNEALVSKLKAIQGVIRVSLYD